MKLDPGLAFRTTSLDDALVLLEPAVSARMRAAPLAGRELPEAIEEAAAAAGLRARRVLLDGRWWTSAAMPMLARLADRRRAPRPGEAARAPDETGWVALLPGAGGRFRMRANGPDGRPLAWEVDEAAAARLAPFAYTFHRTFARKALDAKDVLRFALLRDSRELGPLLASGLIAALLGLLPPIATAHLIDHAIPAASAGGILALLAGLAVAGFALVALEMVRAIALLRFEGSTGVAVQAAVLDRILAAPSRFFRGFSSGDLALRMGAVNTVQRAIAAAAVSTLVAALFGAASLAMMFAYSARLALAALVLAAAVAAISLATGLARVKLGRRIEALDGALGSVGYEYLAGIAKLRAAAAESRAFANWYARYDAFRALGRASAGLANLETTAMSLLQPGATVLVLFLAWRLSSGPGALSAGQFVAFHTALFGLLGATHSLVTLATDLLHLRPLWERAKPILDVLPEGSVGGGLRHEPQGSIELSGVTFAYGNGPQVLRNVDFVARPGEFVALVGPSGSGKSTLLRLLLGFESATAGSVRYDGADLATLDARRLRARIGTVLQDGRLWAGDLYTNIVGAAALPVEAAWEAARLAGLAADIEAMPMGMYTVVGEGLSTLSGGQRQRVLIARALVHRPRILLLDEATSALDNLSQATVLESLSQLTATRIVIAHRLNTVRAADRIYVLDGGRVVQQGTFAELAAAPGEFASLLARQTA